MGLGGWHIPEMPMVPAFFPPSELDAQLAQIMQWQWVHGEVTGDPRIATAYLQRTGTYYDYTTYRRKPRYGSPPLAGHGRWLIHSTVVAGMPFYEQGARVKWQWLPTASRGGKDQEKKNGWYRAGYRWSSNFDKDGNEI